MINHIQRMLKNYVEYKLPLIVSSDPSQGAKNISPLGDAFSIELEQPLIIPRNARNCYITVQNATAWWTVFNVVAGVNDQIDVTYFDGVLTVQKVLTIEAGLYDLAHLDEELTRELVAEGYPSDLFTFVPDQATQKVVIQFNYSGVQLDLSIARNFADLLGFNERLVPLAGQTTGVQYEKSDNVANLNQIEYFLIRSDLVSRGIRINTKYNNVIAQLLINVEPGSQIISEPRHPAVISCDELIGEKRKTIRFFITDQNLNPIDMNGEYFSARLLIHYLAPL